MRSRSLSDSDWDFAARMVHFLRSLSTDEQIAALKRLRGQSDEKPDVIALVEVLLRLPAVEPETTTTVWTPGDEPLPGYRLVQCLGKGGFGQVWKADIGNDFHVALKVISLKNSRVAQLESRALELVKQVRHPHLLSVRRSWTTANQLILEMELADCSLQDRLNMALSLGMAGIAQDELLQYMGEAAEGIDYLNSFIHSLLDEVDACAIQHRDIKPANLLLQGGGIKVADFGLAKAIKSGGASHTGAGSPGYIAPEAQNGRTEIQSDQYSLAATYYHLRTGRVPDPPLDLSHLPRGEAGVLARALSTDPTERWPSCYDFVSALADGVSILRSNDPPASTASFMAADNMTGPRVVQQANAGVTPSAPPEAVLNCLKSFEAFINEHTTNAVPRDHVIGALDAFVNRVRSGYFMIKGAPGMGKSAIMAQLVKSRQYIHHFNIAAESRNTPEQLFNNICAQLIIRFALPYTRIPEGAERNAEFLLRLLTEAQLKRSHPEPLVILIDSLDELAWTSTGTENVLHLPTCLPDGVYVVLTTRMLDEGDPRTRLCVSALDGLTLSADEEWQRQDVERYIDACLQRGHGSAWLALHNLTSRAFVDLLAQKSESNFMYLHHVLPAVGGQKNSPGCLSVDLRVDELPQGLLTFYRQHWNQMRRVNKKLFAEKYEPVICVLAASMEPVTVDVVAEWTGLTIRQVALVFRRWREFLNVEHDSGRNRLYRIYHDSFREFLQDEVDPGLRTYHAMIARFGLRLFDIPTDRP